MATSDEYAQWIIANANKKGTPEFDIVAKAYADSRDNQPAAVNAGRALNSIPRQVGLLARSGVEGLAETAQIVTEPLRYFTDMLVPDRASDGKLSDIVAGKKITVQPKSTPLGVQATKLADWIGLPSPQDANERTVMAANKLMVGAGGTGAVARLAKPVTAIGTKVAEMFGSNPAQQITSAAGAGLAGGASKEANGSDIEQAVAALAGGVAGGKAPDIANGSAIIAKRLFNMGMNTQQLDVKISDVLRQSGVDYSQVPERIRQSLRQEMAGSLNANRELNPEAVSRLLAFQSTGVTPTRGMISQNPVQITREQNLAKMGANSNDAGLQGLALVQNQNNSRLIGNLNELGANRGNVLAAGEHVANSVLGTQAGLRGAEQSAWDAARATPGYRKPISAQAISDINGALGQEGLMPFMNPQISRYMEAFQNGQPFTPQDYRNLQSMLSREIQKGGNEGAAASMAARILRDSELQPAGFVNAGNLPVTQGMATGMRNADNAATESIDAVNAARRATRSAYAYEDSNPLVRSVLSDGASSDPQRIAQRFVIGGTPNEAEHLVNQVGPRGLPVIKDAILAHLKSKAVNGAADETAKFSQSAFNKALRDIGDRKLALLFTQEELTALQNNGRVAALMQSQPVGSAVNNSNSGALLLGRGLDFLNHVPVVGPMAGPALKNIQITYGNNQARNIAPGLLADQPKRPIGANLLAPGVAIGGLLAAP
jgi:hypothetical protein